MESVLRDVWILSEETIAISIAPVIVKTKYATFTQGRVFNAKTLIHEVTIVKNFVLQAVKIKNATKQLVTVLMAVLSNDGELIAQKVVLKDVKDKYVMNKLVNV